MSLFEYDILKSPGEKAFQITKSEKFRLLYLNQLDFIFSMQMEVSEHFSSILEQMFFVIAAIICNPFQSTPIQ